MREQLIRYIDLLFAGAPEAAEIKQEILQNTLDRYDDLIAQGKSPEGAYRLAISGIGDINEILGTPPQEPHVSPSPAPQEIKKVPMWKTVVRAIAIALYIMCPIPLFVIQDEIGLCGLLGMVAIATVLMVITGKDAKASSHEKPAENSPRAQLKKSISSVVWTVGLCLYFVLSFLTRAWAITWVIFPLLGCIDGLVNACIDLKEAKRNEI